MAGITTFFTDQCLNLRHNASIPAGKCVYVQSGDPGDFDGYLIGVAGTALEAHTKQMQLALVIPERRACSDRTETDVNKHDEAFSEQVLSISGRLFRLLCPKAFIVRGPLNARNIIPLKFIFSEPEKYGPLLAKQQDVGQIYWRSVRDLADIIRQDDVTSVLLDMNGSMSYLKLLMDFYPDLGKKVKAAGMPITVMAGILAEAETTTLRVPGRDPRSTMNAIYHADSVRLLLDMATSHGVNLLFVTNNVCNTLLKFEDGQEVIQSMALSGLMAELASVWYGPHLKGKCVPFDWVSFCGMLMHNRYPELMKVEKRELWVGKDDASVLVLRDPGTPETPVVHANLENTKLWGVVESLVWIDKDAMLQLSRAVASRSSEAR